MGNPIIYQWLRRQSTVFFFFFFYQCYKADAHRLQRSAAYTVLWLSWSVPEHVSRAEEWTSLRATIGNFQTLRSAHMLWPYTRTICHQERSTRMISMLEDSGDKSSILKTCFGPGEYLPLLQEHQKWSQLWRNFKPGDVVLLVGSPHETHGSWESYSKPYLTVVEQFAKWNCSVRRITWWKMWGKRDWYIKRSHFIDVLRLLVVSPTFLASLLALTTQRKATIFMWWRVSSHPASQWGTETALLLIRGHITAEVQLLCRSCEIDKLIASWTEPLVPQ